MSEQTEREHTLSPDCWCRPEVLNFEGDPPDIEALAAAEHESWSGWMKHMLRKILEECAEESTQRNLGTDIMDPEPLPGELYSSLPSILDSLPCVRRWRRQMNTKYEDLPEEEKESDRIEARKKLTFYRTKSADTKTAEESVTGVCAIGQCREAAVVRRRVRIKGPGLGSPVSVATEHLYCGNHDPQGDDRCHSRSCRGTRGNHPYRHPFTEGP